MYQNRTPFSWKQFLRIEKHFFWIPSEFGTFEKKFVCIAALLSKQMWNWGGYSVSTKAFFGFFFKKKRKRHIGKFLILVSSDFSVCTIFISTYLRNDSSLGSQVMYNWSFVKETQAQIHKLQFFERNIFQVHWISLSCKKGKWLTCHNCLLIFQKICAV